MAPSVESAHGNQTPSLTDRNPERRVFENGFRTGVDPSGCGPSRHPPVCAANRESAPTGNTGSVRPRSDRIGRCETRRHGRAGGDYGSDRPSGRNAGQVPQARQRGKYDNTWHDRITIRTCTARSRQKRREHDDGRPLSFSYGKNYFVAFVKLPSLSKSSTVLSARATL